jgi:hypothetical protein
VLWKMDDTHFLRIAKYMRHKFLCVSITQLF